MKKLTSHNLPLFLSCCIVAIIAIANLARFLWNIPVIVDGLHIPNWTGALIFIIFGLLAAWAFKAFFAKEISP